MIMIFYFPLEKSYISLLSKKNGETIPLSLKKSSMMSCIHLLDPGGQTSEVFFKVGFIMYYGYMTPLAFEKPFLKKIYLSRSDFSYGPYKAL